MLRKRVSRSFPLITNPSQKATAFEFFFVEDFFFSITIKANGRGGNKCFWPVAFEGMVELVGCGDARGKYSLFFGCCPARTGDGVTSQVNHCIYVLGFKSLPSMIF